MVPAAAIAVLAGGVGTSVTLTHILVATVLNVAIASVLGKLLAPSVGSGRDTRGLQTVVKNNISPRTVVYGECLVGGTFLEFDTSGDTNNFLNMIIAIATHPVDDILGVFVGDQYIDIHGDDNNNNGLLPAEYYVRDGGKFGSTDVNDPSFNIMRIIKVNGWGWADNKYVTDETRTECVNDRARSREINDYVDRPWTVPAEGLISRDTGTGLYDSNSYRVTNCAYVFLQLEYDSDVWGGQIPRFRFHVKGKRLYNPYLDNTNMVEYGAPTNTPTGETAHDLLDPDTYTWSDDWTLCTLDYLTDRQYGLAAKTQGTQADPEEIDWEYAISSYLASSEIISNGMDTPDNGFVPRYTINGVFECSQTPISIVEAMLTSGAGELVYAQGKYKLLPGIYRAPNSPNDIINESDIVSNLSIKTHNARSDVFNKAAGVFVDKKYDPSLPIDQEDNLPLFESSDFPFVDPTDSSGLNPYEVIDGEEIIREFDFPYTTDSSTAQRLAKIQIERSRRGMVVSFEGTLNLIKHSVGDNVYLEILSDGKYFNEDFYNKLGFDSTVQLRPDTPFTAYYKQFKITDMEYTENSTIAVTMIEEDEGIYEWNDGDANPPSDEIIAGRPGDNPWATVLPPDWTVSTPFNAITEVVGTVAGSPVRTLIRWSAPVRDSANSDVLDITNIGSYRLEYGLVDNPSEALPENRVSDWISAGSTIADPSTITQGPVGLSTLFLDNTDYDFRVRSVTYTGRASAWAYYSVSEGVDYTPGQPPLSAQDIYYILPTNGTSIHNSTGTLTLEARQIIDNVDTLISSGNIQLYVNGTTLVTIANGYASPSDGYTGTFDAGDISGSLVVELRDGSGGTLLDSITLVDIADGADPVIANYSNAAHTVPVDNLGNETWTGSGGLLRVLEGNTFLTLRTNTQTGDHTGLSNGEFQIDITKVSGDTLTEPSITGETTTFCSLGEWSSNLTTATVYRLNIYIQDSSGTQHIRIIDVTLSPSFEGSDGDPGESAGVVVLSNEAVSLTADNAGTVLSYVGSGVDITAYIGTTQLTYAASGANTFSVGTPVATNITVGSASTVGGNIRRFADASAMTQNIAFIDFPVTLRDSTGVTHAVITRRQSFSKSLQGEIGAVGWGHDLEFSISSPTDVTVSWTAGTVKTAVGTTYDIPAGNTTSNIISGYTDISDTPIRPWYIYLDAFLGSPYELIVTDVMVDSVGEDKILIAVATAAQGTAVDATFQVFGGRGGLKIAADEIAANSIGANNISAAFYQGAVFTGGVFQTRQPVDSSPYASVPRAAVQNDNPYFGLWAPEGGPGNGPDQLVFSIDDQGQLFIKGGIEDNSISNNIFNSAGLTILRGALGINEPGGGETGGLAQPDTPIYLGTAPADNPIINPSPATPNYTTGPGENTLTFRIYDSGTRTSSAYTVPQWTCKFQYSTTSASGPWSDIPGHTPFTVTGSINEYTEGGFPPVTYYEFFLNETRTFVWDTTGTISAGADVWFNLVTDWDSGSTNVPRLTTLSASEPIAGNQIDALTELVDTVIASPSGGQLLIYDGTDSWRNRSITGDISLSSTGVVSLAADSVGTNEIAASGTPSSSTYLRGDMTWQAITGVSAGTVTSALLRWSGTAWVQTGTSSTNAVLVDSSNNVIIANTAPYLRINDSDSPANEHDWRIRGSGGDLLISNYNDAGTLVETAISIQNLGASGVGVITVNGDELRLFPSGDILMGNPIFINEQADANGNISAYGQIWVKNDAPNTLWFRDDTGVDHQLGVGASVSGAPVNNQIAIWTGPSTIEGTSGLTYSGSLLNVNVPIRSISGANYTEMSYVTDTGYITTISNSDLILRHGTENYIWCESNGGVVMYYNGTSSARTQSIGGGDNTSSLNIEDGASTAVDVGFNVLNWYDPSGVLGSTNAEWRNYAGQILLSTATESWTLPANTATQVPSGWTIMIVVVSGTLTLNAGASTTLTWMDGSTSPPTGSRTLATGAVATITRRSSTLYYIWGNAGIS